VPRPEAREASPVSETGVQRRLAAILAADVVGYSRLMGQDEARTLTAVTDYIGRKNGGQTALDVGITHPLKPPPAFGLGICFMPA
jgi:hypothetical protein